MTCPRSYKSWVREPGLELVWSEDKICAFSHLLGCVHRLQRYTTDTGPSLRDSDSSTFPKHAAGNEDREIPPSLSVIKCVQSLETENILEASPHHSSIWLEPKEKPTWKLTCLDHNKEKIGMNSSLNRDYLAWKTKAKSDLINVGWWPAVH